MKIRPVVCINPIVYLISLPFVLAIKLLTYVAIFVIKWMCLGIVYLTTKLYAFAEWGLPRLWSNARRCWSRINMKAVSVDHKIKHNDNSGDVD